jgi:fatty acid desaturase
MGPCESDVVEGLSPRSAEALGLRLVGPGTGAMAELVRRRPLRVTFDAIVCWVVIALAFALLAVVPAWWSAVIAFLVIGNRQYALSILAHDGDHRTLLRSRRRNDALNGILLCPAVGIDPGVNREHHLAHHRLLATEADPDRYTYSVDDKSTRAGFLLFLSGLPMFPRALRKMSRGGAPGGGGLRDLVAMLRRRAPSVIAQLVLLAAVSATQPWWHYLVFWLGPIYPLGFIPHKVRMFCEHAQPVAPDAAADGRRLITYLPGWLERRLFAPYNLNFHAEHHIWPYAPYHALHRLHPLLAGVPGVEIRRSYVGFVLDYFARLPLAVAPARPEGDQVAV